MPIFCIDTVLPLTLIVRKAPLEIPLMHSGAIDIEKASIPWLLIPRGIVQLTRMLEALSERALVSMDSVDIQIAAMMSDRG